MQYFCHYTAGAYKTDYVTCPSSRNPYITEPSFDILAVFSQTHPLSYYTSLPARRGESLEWSRIWRIDQVQLMADRGCLQSVYAIKAAGSLKAPRSLPCILCFVFLLSSCHHLAYDVLTCSLPLGYKYYLNKALVPFIAGLLLPKIILGIEYDVRQLSVEIMIVSVIERFLDKWPKFRVYA